MIEILKEFPEMGEFFESAKNTYPIFISDKAFLGVELRRDKKAYLIYQGMPRLVVWLRGQPPQEIKGSQKEGEFLLGSSPEVGDFKVLYTPKKGGRVWEAIISIAPNGAIEIWREEEEHG